MIVKRVLYRSRYFSIRRELCECILINLEFVVPCLEALESNLVSELIGDLAGTLKAKREIVYPCIPYPNGEDERGQPSSFLAVSTRWISAAKLLQSGLATLAQRDGGE
ncbi:hypothetical protein B296_00006569 [Ensete ventricosum]|uniref:Uncharacterized protein n=1 Tax=Ensete ventricosum TaxID=4639 RepID=A0A426YW63_ENSVE|nr:hypothetical protein B296_00006569 [Ensete ventricosum]